MKKTLSIKTILIIFLFLAISYQQRGGGGGSSGGGSSGGGSSYSYSTPSYSSPSYSPSYSSGGYYPGGYYGSSYNSYYPYSQSYGSGMSDTISTIITIIVMAIIGFIALIVFCCTCGCICCRNSISANQPANSYSSNNNNYVSPSFSTQNQFERQKQLHNQVNEFSMSGEEFQLKLNQFVDLINGTSNKTSSFTYKQGIISYPINNASVKSQRQTNLLYRIQMRGADQLGAWSGRGYFLNTNTGVVVWWMKDYYNKDLAGQTGQWSHLVYKSTQCNYNDWNGVWYYVGFEGNYEYSGTWNLGLGQLAPPPLQNINAFENLFKGTQQKNKNNAKLNNNTTENNAYSNPYANVEYAQI